MARQDITPVDDIRGAEEALEGRDAPLWPVGALIVLVLVSAVCAIVFPEIMWRLGPLRIDGRYLPPLLFAFVALIVLVSAHTFTQRRNLRATGQELLRQLVRSEATERLSMVDPLTETFNRRYLDQVLTKEASRADRRESTLTFLMIDLDEFKSVNARFGNLVGDRVLSEVGHLLKGTFRMSDSVIRYGGDEFLVVMPETNEPQAQRALERLFVQVGYWNRENSTAGYKLSFSCGLASYRKGARVEAVLEAAEQRMVREKAAHSTA